MGQAVKKTQKPGIKENIKKWQAIVDSNTAILKKLRNELGGSVN